MQLEIGLFLKRKIDNELFYISTHHKDDTFTLRCNTTNRIYGKFTRDQIEKIFYIAI